MDAIAQEQLSRREAEIAAVRTPEDAARRNARVRRLILERMGGLPDYRGPLNAAVTGEIRHPRYAIEKLVYESLPGYHVTANLYRPLSPGRHPAVLFPVGHWREGKAAVQTIAANLALKGFVVLVYDPVGQGERLQGYDERLGGALAGQATNQHMMAGAQSRLAGEWVARYMIWDGMRGLDYLATRPEVDAERIGCTGCSGGGTLATFISALDPRIKVAAPTCYMNSFRVLFSTRVGDSEQNLPGLLEAGLDQTDFVELFAPKPWLIGSTEEDFFTPAGARLVYEEARRWYRIYGAEERIRWVVGPGPHGTPLAVREAIYEWMIRWLKDGRGDHREESFQPHPEHELWATATGQVATSLKSRDLWEVILERFRQRRRPGSPEEAVAELRRLLPARPSAAPAMKLTETASAGAVAAYRVSLETQPGLSVDGHLLVPRAAGRKPAVLMAATEAAVSPAAKRFAERGAVVLVLLPRGLPVKSALRPLIGDRLPASRAELIGLNMPALRAFDLLRGLDALAARDGVDPGRIAGAGQNIAGIWMLMAAALDARLARVWLDSAPHSFLPALERPVHRNLHDALLPGFALRWDIEDLVKALGAREVIWTDPTDWTRPAVPKWGRFFHRYYEQDDAEYIERLLASR